MKVAIICHPAVGGSSRIACELAVWLTKQDIETHIISYSHPVLLLENKPPQLKVHTVSIPFFEALPHHSASEVMTSKISHIVETENIDIVHAHYAMPYSICLELAKKICKRKFKSIVTLHGTDVTQCGIDNQLNRLIQYSLKQQDALTCVSPPLLKHCNKNLSPDLSIHVVPNFIDPSLWFPPRETIHSKIIRFIHVSNFRSLKRLDKTIDLIHRLKQTYSINLTLIGEGPQLESVVQKVSELKLENFVVFKPSTTNILSELQNSDIYISMSEQESFGLSTLEAMSCELPVLVPNIPGFSHWIQDKQHGLLFENMQDAYTKAALLIEDPQLRKKLGQAARQKSVETFAIENIASQYLKLYQNII